MKSQLMILALGAAALGLSACSKEPAKDNTQLTLHEIMKDQIDKHADEL